MAGCVHQGEPSSPRGSSWPSQRWGVLLQGEDRLLWGDTGSPDRPHPCLELPPPRF